VGNFPILSLCNFTATVFETSYLLSALDKVTSEIIDALSNSDYVFLDVSVIFGSPQLPQNRRLQPLQVC
jgi:hypothetical protein